MDYVRSVLDERYIRRKFKVEIGLGIKIFDSKLTSRRDVPNVAKSGGGVN